MGWGTWQEEDDNGNYEDNDNDDEKHKDDDEEHLVMTGLKKQHITILNLLELKNQHRSIIKTK